MHDVDIVYHILTMKKHKENLFSTKFQLLNSQEHSEEINWSSSDSSEFDDCNNRPQQPDRTKKLNLKRKRKPKVLGNVSNLDIAIIDTVKESPSQISPVLISKKKPKTVEAIQGITYLIEENTENNYCEVTNASPVLCTGQFRANLCMKSPIIAQKFASPANSPKVKKILFKGHANISNTTNQHNTELVQSKYFKLDRRKTPEDIEKQIEISTPVQSQNSVKILDDGHKDEKSVESSSKRVNVDLIRKVKSFFDNHFNSDNSSQPSIADSLTPQNASSDDIEILSSITQVNSHENSIKSVKNTNSTDNTDIEAEKSKKMRYKKDGLAYRLNALLKKHNANISLWQHERFLAENSNFKIPKGEHSVFRILNSSFKFGCFLLEATDVNDEMFLILINQIYVNNCTFKEDVIFKLYEPYQMFDFVNHKLIVNVCKFECDNLDV